MDSHGRPIVKERHPRNSSPAALQIPLPPFLRVSGKTSRRPSRSRYGRALANRPASSSSVKSSIVCPHASSSRAGRSGSAARMKTRWSSGARASPPVPYDVRPLSRTIHRSPPNSRARLRTSTSGTGPRARDASWGRAGVGRGDSRLRPPSPLPVDGEGTDPPGRSGGAPGGAEGGSDAPGSLAGTGRVGAGSDGGCTLGELGGPSSSVPRGGSACGVIMSEHWNHTRSHRPGERPR